MARPRVFVSSTYYDLKHLRSSLENFVQALGLDATLSEKGKIAYTPDLPLDESCYREVASSDILVLIIGGRYGSEVSGSAGQPAKSFYDRYNSITRGEYQSALKRDVPIYVLVERSVQAEYETYLRNKTNDQVVYAHVDSVNVFELIEYVLSQPRNNPVQQFEKYSEIEIWLKEQWAGLFRELLQRMQGQQQIASLQAQVSQLSELNTTLKRYLEELVSRIAPNESVQLIEKETERLKDAAIDQIIANNPLGSYLVEDNQLSAEHVRLAVIHATSVGDFLQRLRTSDLTSKQVEVLERLDEPYNESLIHEDINLLRTTIGIPMWNGSGANPDTNLPFAASVITPRRPSKRSSRRKRV